MNIVAGSSSNDAPEQYTSQRGGYDNGRGDRGRGRGWQGRGRGDNFRGSGRGGRGQGGDGRSEGNRQPRGGSQGDYQRGGRGGNHYQNNSNGQSQQQRHQSSPQQPGPFQSPPSVQAGAYMNPMFSNQLQPGPQSLPPLTPEALAHAMAFMNTQAGMQSMAAFASHITGTSDTPQSSQSPAVQSIYEQPYQSPTQHNDRKRKRGSGNWQTSPPHPPKRQQQANEKPQKAKATPAPAVPSFGFTLPAVQTRNAPPATKSERKNKRPVNLGLTRLDSDQEPESAEEEVDEEAAFSATIQGGGAVFEHEGESISLQTPGEVMAWIKDRRKNFPTQHRITEKAQEAAEKRAHDLEFLRKVIGKPEKRYESQRTPATPKAVKAVEANKPSAADLKDREELSRLRRAHHESMLNKAGVAPRTADKKPQAVDLGLGYGSDTESEADENSVLDDSSVVSSAEESSDESALESEHNSDAEDSDAPPDEKSSKKPIPSIVVPPPPPPPPPITTGTSTTTTKKAQNPNKNDSDICYQFKQFGKCKFGAKCRYTHASREKKRVGLYEMMVEQEVEKAERLALDAIKYLGRHGFLG
ncbi:hypothetical protein BDV95DRAFT_626487 [Massariosphaeria phaeospora]|uniref:C3H1-type domain-containing protein n=1 Tax=Massariosphaeria phaeospora TaxID=100035 RepID=A0A7C8MTZ1_9PLEO|nr:hypothetical protein BDV95DRAFT_626487 [Massariosphaeria phaeospora]